MEYYSAKKEWWANDTEISLGHIYLTEKKKSAEQCVWYGYATFWEG